MRIVGRLARQAACCALAAQTMLWSPPAMSVTPPQAAVEEVWDLLSQNYFDEAAVGSKDFQSARALGAQATKSKVESLKRQTLNALNGDAYTRLVDQRGFEELFKYDVLGLGLILEPSAEGFAVLSPPVPGSGAVGKIVAGDIVEELDGVKTKGKTSFQLLEIVESNKQATLKLKGKDSVTLERKVVSTDSISKDVVNEVGYVKVSEFNAKTADRFVEVLRDLEKQGVKRLVVDLRGNRGGSFQSGVAAASALLPRGAPTVSVIERSGEETYYVDGKNQLRFKPVEVWLDATSASSAEIFASALRDNCAAVVAGDSPSFGKGLIQAVYGLKSYEGGGLIVTVAQYLRPSGLPIQGQGIVPDVPLSRPKFLGGLFPSATKVPSAADLDDDFDTALALCEPPKRRSS